MAVEKELTPQEANERDKAALRRAAESAERGSGVEDEPDDDGEPERGEEPEPEVADDEVVVERPSRQERRRQRFPDMERELASTKQQLAELNQRMQQMQPVQQQAPQQQFDVEAWADGQLRAIRAGEMRLAKYAQALGNNITQEDVDALQAEQDNLQRQRVQVMLQQERAQQQHQAPAPVNPVAAFVNAKYVDVINNQMAMAHARVKHLELINQGRSPVDAMEEAYQYGRAQANPQAARRPPSEQQRARYTGSSGNGGQGSHRLPQQKTLTEEEAKAADLTFKYIPDVKKRRAAYYDKIKAPQLRRQNRA